MKPRLLSPKEAPSRAELLVGLVFEGVMPKLGGDVDVLAKKARALGDLLAEFRKVSVFYPSSSGGPQRVAFVGMGKPKDLTAERLRRAAAIAQERAESLGVGEFQLWINEADLRDLDAGVAARALAEGLVLGAYRYEPPRKQKPEARKAQRAAVVFGGKAQKKFAAGFASGVIGADATVFARDLGNKPPNECTPKYLADQAKKLAGSGITVKVLEQRDMERLGMGALLGVARGSEQPPKLILLEYRPPQYKRTIGVIGKGLTFDSGGISIKPSAKMDEMRYDMCGGAAVLGLFHAIRGGALKGKPLRTRIVGAVAASENMPDAAAQKPGDVVRACDGTTIEILNTDAEGRLVLADALAYVRKTYEPDRMVDLATLTGAVVVALGHEVAGVMGNDEELTKALIRAGRDADEPLWELPLWDVHKEQMKSKFADLANINGPAHGNGSTAGGAFLSYFVGDTPWCHLDIAGTAWGGIAKDYYRSGAAGTAVRTLLRWVETLG
jgi:leucyl aminopeptidase